MSAHLIDVTTIPVFQVRHFDRISPLIAPTWSAGDLYVARQDAIRRGNPARASLLRRAIEQNDDQATWEDAEWQ
jgi:hypothetical protein